jgi:hypothetical protein
LHIANIGLFSWALEAFSQTTAVISFRIETLEIAGEAIAACCVAFLHIVCKDRAFLFCYYDKLLTYGASLDHNSNAKSFFVMLSDSKASNRPGSDSPQIETNIGRLSSQVD